MDPNETLNDLRIMTRSVLNNGAESTSVVDDMAELFEALDDWLSKGGFLPDVWQR